MLAFLYTLAFLFVSPLLAYAHPPVKNMRPAYPFSRVEWATYPETVAAGQVVTLSWTGGSGNGYEVYYIPQWEGQTDYSPVDIATTTLKTIKWRVPKHDKYPEGTTFILAVNDVTEGPGSSFYDLTSLLNFVKRK